MLALYFSLISSLVLAYLTWLARIDPLKRIPGPWLWSISRFPYIYHLYRGTLVHEIGRLHLKYGQKVRIAPDEVSFSSNDAWKDIYTRRANGLLLTRDQVWQRSGPPGTNNLTTAPIPDHDRMRKVLGRGFELSALPEKETIIQKHTLRMVSKIRESLTKNGRVDLASWMSFCAFDTIGELTFGAEIFHCNALGSYPPSILSMFRHAKNQAKAACLRYSPFAFVEHLPEWVRPWSALTQNREDALITLLMTSLTERAKLAGVESKRSKDFMAVLLDGTEKGELNQTEMGANAGLMLGGGGETVAAALGGIFNYLLRKPSTLTELTEQIRQKHQNHSEISGSTLEGIDLLTWVIEEGMRLSCPIPCGIPRVVPAECDGIDICGSWIPSKCHVSVQPWLLFRDPKKWYQSSDFIPERWAPRTPQDNSPYRNDGRACMRPFSWGAMRCLGQTLARLEMRLAIAHLVFAFDMEASDGPQGEEFLLWENQTTGTLWDRQPFYVKATPVSMDTLAEQHAE